MIWRSRRGGARRPPTPTHLPRSTAGLFVNFRWRSKKSSTRKHITEAGAKERTALRIRLRVLLLSNWAYAWAAPASISGSSAPSTARRARASACRCRGFSFYPGLLRRSMAIAMPARAHAHFAASSPCALALANRGHDHRSRPHTEHNRHCQEHERTFTPLACPAPTSWSSRSDVDGLGRKANAAASRTRAYSPSSTPARLLEPVERWSPLIMVNQLIMSSPMTTVNTLKYVS